MTPGRLVHVVDDDPGARESLRWLLESVHLRVETHDSGDAFLSALDEATSCCVILDLRMPGASGLAVLDQLSQRTPPPPAIMVTAFGTVSTTARAMRAGAVHVLEKPYDDQQLLDAIQEAFELDDRRRAHHAQSTAVTERLATLTPREREVLDRVVSGASTKVIARELQVSAKNVEHLRSSIYRKLHVANLTELVRLMTPVETPRLR